MLLERTSVRPSAATAATASAAAIGRGSSAAERVLSEPNESAAGLAAGSSAPRSPGVSLLPPSTTAATSLSDGGSPSLNTQGGASSSLADGAPGASPMLAAAEPLPDVPTRS